jgi:hypothetical protein
MGRLDGAELGATLPARWTTPGTQEDVGSDGCYEPLDMQNG